MTVSGDAVGVTGTVYERDVPCLDNGSGAGYDTVFALTERAEQHYGIWAPMLDLVSDSPVTRLVGSFDVWTTPDTTPQFAGAATLSVDSTGCWRVQPWSAGPEPRLALATAPPLTAGSRQAWNAYLMGSLVAGSPPACGDARSVSALTLAVYVALY